MGYFNNQTGYPTDILSTRAIIKRGNYALIPPNGLVRNVIPGFENCDVTILSTPKLGATFVDYLVTLHDCGRNTKGFGGEELETFVYVIDGAITASADATDYPLTAGGYLYCPAGVTLRLETPTAANPAACSSTSAAISTSRVTRRTWSATTSPTWRRSTTRA